MMTLENHIDAMDALARFKYLHLDVLTPEMAQKYNDLCAANTSVPLIVKAGELLYANRAELPPEWLEFGAALLAFATQHGFHGLQDDNRGTMMVQTLRRDMGEKALPGYKYHKSSNDPAPHPDFEIVESPIDPIS